MKKLLVMAMVSVFTLGACSSTGERDTASTKGESHHYVPVGLER